MTRLTAWLGRVGFFGHIAEPCAPAELKENTCPDEQDGEDDEGDTPAALPLGELMPVECGASASLHALEGISGLLARGECFSGLSGSDAGLEVCELALQFVALGIPLGLLFLRVRTSCPRLSHS